MGTRVTKPQRKVLELIQDDPGLNAMDLERRGVAVTSGILGRLERSGYIKWGPTSSHPLGFNYGWFLTDLGKGVIYGG